jgi:hypothetical protein
LIELPAGSFFVRYFFNRVEAIHPFADNMKPLSRYFNWVVRREPSALPRLLLDLLPNYLIAYGQVQIKKGKDMWREMQGKTRSPQLEMAGEGQWASEAFEAAVLEIQKQIRKKVGRLSKGASVGTFLGLVLRLASLFMFLLTIRSFVMASYRQMALYLAIALALSFASSILSRLLDRLLATPYLLEAAGELSRLFNSEKGQGPGSARYHIFGHDHYATFKEVRDDSPYRPPFRQWYVNTGCWIPVFSEEDQLLRGANQLTFLRLVPGQPGFDQGAPELLQWSSEAGCPYEIRLFSDSL